MKTPTNVYLKVLLRSAMLVLDEEEEDVVLRVPKCCPQKLPRKLDDGCCPSVTQRKPCRYRISHLRTKEKAFWKK